MTVAQPCPVPQQSTPATPVTLPPGFRLVPALIGRPGNAHTVHIPCPAWCDQDHAADRQVAIEDIWHSGPHMDLEMPRAGQSPALLAFARLCVDPYSSDPRRREPYLYVEDGGGSSDGYQRRSEAQQFARGLMAFAEQVLALSERLPE